jgi:hypothetical protein
VSDEFFRKFCLEWYAWSVREGYFLAARLMLRNALKFRRGGRAKSLAVGYGFHNGKLLWYHWGN